MLQSTSETSRSVSNTARKTNKTGDDSDISLALDQHLSREPSTESESKRIKSGIPKLLDAPVNKRPKSSRLPIRKPWANEGILAQVNLKKHRASKPSRIPVVVRAHRNAQQKTHASSKEPRISRIPIRVDGLTSKPSPLKLICTGQKSISCAEIKLQGNELQMSTRNKKTGPSRQPPRKIIRPNSGLEGNVAVSGIQISFKNDGKSILEIDPKKHSADRLNSETESTKASENEVTKKLARDILVSKEPEANQITEIAEENTFVAKQTMSISCARNTTQQQEGTLNIESPIEFLKDMKSMLSDLQNKCQILERAVEIGVINAMHKQAQVKQETLRGSETLETTEDIHFEPLYTSTPKPSQISTNDHVDEMVRNSETETSVCLVNKVTTKMNELADLNPEENSSEKKKSILVTAPTLDTKEDGSFGIGKKAVLAFNTNESAYMKPKPTLNNGPKEMGKIIKEFEAKSNLKEQEL